MAKPHKQLLNSIESCVDEMLEGVAAVNLGVKILKGHRVVVRADIEEVKNRGQVTVLSGGGSGHEPFAAGFVGKGMLSAAVAGSVFTSPPPNAILTGIRAIAGSSGVLLIVANYTGDRLNFGIAAERAAAEGIKVATVTIGEDCALTSDKTAGRRGLCGIVLLMKIVGALAEECRSLKEIETIAMEATKAVGTIGVSISPCHVPGSGATFDLGNDEMELGLGVHGEAGVKRMKVLPADDIAAVMIDHMTDQTHSSHMTIGTGDRVALVLNNLGATSFLEMFVMVRGVVRYLESKSVVVERVYVDHFMTSLDMAGLSLTILHLTDLRLKCLDKDTNAIGWQRMSTSNTVQSTQRGRDRFEPRLNTSNKCLLEQRSNEAGDDDAPLLLRRVLENVCRKLIMSESSLNELDRHGGDGDCGTTLKTGAQVILNSLEKYKNFSVYGILSSVSECLENTMGGASGGLYSLFLTAAAGSLRTDTSPPSWINALKSGITAVSRYGGAEPGDRTMLDPLDAAYTSLVTAQKTGDDWISLLENAVKAADKAASETASMKAKAGRASYVNAQLITKPDPGASAVAVWMNAILESLKG